MLADGCACFAEIARHHEGAIRLSNAWGCPRHDRAESEDERDRAGDTPHPTLADENRKSCRRIPRAATRRGRFPCPEGERAEPAMLDWVSNLLLTIDEKCKHKTFMPANNLCSLHAFRRYSSGYPSYIRCYRYVLTQACTYICTIVCSCIRKGEGGG